MGLCAILTALALTLATSTERRSGTNLTPNFEYILALRGGQEACEQGELLPADTAALRVPAEAIGAPAPPLEVTATLADGGAITSGSLAGGWRGHDVRVPVRLVRHAVPDARVCVRDRQMSGASAALMLGGDRNDPGLSIQMTGYTIYQQHLRYEYLRPGSESWFELLPLIAYRFSLGKAGFLRHWEWWAMLVLVIGTFALTIRLALREIAPDRPERQA